MISSQVFGIVYHLNGLSGNTNIRYNQFPAPDMIFFNFEKKEWKLIVTRPTKLMLFGNNLKTGLFLSKPV